MNQPIYYINGNYVPESEAKLSVFDLSILRGFGVFDYLRTYKKRLFHLWDHLERLSYSAENLRLKIPCSLEEIAKIIDSLIALNHLEEAGIKILVTGGISPDQFTPQTASLIVLVFALTKYPKCFYTKGISAITTSLARSFPKLKTTQYIPAIVTLHTNHQAKEAIYLNQDRELLEATTSNFFCFKKNTLYTCNSDEILLGITREIILKLAASKFPIQFFPITYEELPTVDEAFITSSNKEIMPIVKIDHHPIGTGKVGIKTKELIQAFKKYTQQPEWAALSIPRHNVNK
ncbi:D-alanine aminotransferase [Candidatus Rhabdochlamydia oedothoracis]|uniref:branched-chain-amino-acid transaminase n=1 Tax=Candidatus Rhabdochlamydia oedothoracis TaxID=2720720 RepID=A0ABX8V6Z4_9BACT|nr:MULTISPECIES: aminotransferase class IV [Rhabdochlamydia]KAG6559004.1 D-alanine aminotransferase [Candidatus Rhabdochlamydia sp. W815]MCL6756246.1 aminotransferase class IV [Candidatus Rhabdochlamydia oedothoracis]QYF49362.1 D-alanine aminotransferase [Candidatus Rhabdochlamydia oedothoracis]